MGPLDYPDSGPLYNPPCECGHEYEEHEIVIGKLRLQFEPAMGGYNIAIPGRSYAAFVGHTPDGKWMATAVVDGYLRMDGFATRQSAAEWAWRASRKGRMDDVGPSTTVCHGDAGCDCNEYEPAAIDPRDEAEGRAEARGERI